MSRRARLHVPGGFYYVSQRCGPEEQLFSTDEDYQKFAKYFGKVLKPLKMRLHGYCWLPSEFHLLIEVGGKVGDEPVGELVKRLANHLTYRIHGSKSAPSLFPERHHQVLIDPVEYMLKALRVIHRRSVPTGTQGQLNGYEWSSHLVYLGVMEAPWLTTYVALGRFNRHAERARLAYADYSMTPPPESELRMFEEQPGRDPRVLGDSFFVRRLGIGLPILAKTTLEELTKIIALRMGLDPEQVRSGAQSGDLPLARAAITWHGVARGITSKTRAAQFFGVDRTTLPKAIAKNLKLHPEWFDLGHLPDVGPIVSASSAMTMTDVSSAPTDDDDGSIEADIEADAKDIEAESDSDWPTHEPQHRLHGLTHVH